MTKLTEEVRKIELQKEIVEIEGLRFLCTELPLSKRNRLIADLQQKYKGDAPEEAIEAALLAACVLDPDTGEPVAPGGDPEFWKNVPARFGRLLQVVIRVNGLQGDPVEDVAKN